MAKLAVADILHASCCVLGDTGTGPSAEREGEEGGRDAAGWRRGEGDGRRQRHRSQGREPPTRRSPGARGSVLGHRPPDSAHWGVWPGSLDRRAS